MLRLAGHRLEGSSRMGMEMMKDSSFGRALSRQDKGLFAKPFVHAHSMG